MAGRPTDYDASIAIQGVSDYMDLCKEKSFLPTVAGLAVQMGVARSTIYLWAENHPEFSDILELLLSQQESQLIQNSLVGMYNAPITKLLLTKHGYTDKSDVTSNGKGLTVTVPLAVADKFNLHGADKEAGRSDTQ